MKSSIILLLVFFQATISAQEIQKQALNVFIKTPGLDNGLVGVAIKDLSGRNVLIHNEHTPLAPASTLKVLTTATALEVLGPDFRYTTYIGTGNDSNELVVKGTGDPTLGSVYNKDGVKQNFSYQSSFLTTWQNVISKHFSEAKEGLNILIDDSYYGYQGVSRKWVYEDIGNYYGAGIYGLNIYDNTYNLELNTENTKQPPRILKTFPMMRQMSFTNLLDYNTTGKDNGYIVCAPMSNDATLIGDVPQGKSSFTIKGAIPNPGMFLGESLRTKLESGGLLVKGVRTAKDYYLSHRFTNDTVVFHPFYAHQSIPLSSICRIINIVSNNEYSESLIRRIGREGQPNIYTEPLEAGLSKVSDFWSSKGLNVNELSMYDGCGLAPSNAVSADFLTSILVYMQTKSKNGSTYLNTFPKAGIEGTVRTVMSNSNHKGSVFMKSGSIGGVQAFSGYYVNGEKILAFTVLVNKYTCSRTQVIKAIEKLLETALN